MKGPLVSIVLPTYNGKYEWLSMAVESVISQSYMNWELIIINDASTNDIEKTILSYTHKDERIKYLKNEKNRERSYSKNRGILESKGKYIAFIDDDDFWSDSTKIEKQISFLEKYPDYGLCGCSVHIIDEYGFLEKEIAMRETDKEIKDHLLQFNQLAQSAVVIRKEMFALSGLFLDGFIPSEDAELWLRVCKYTKVYNLQSSYIEYRNRPTNSSNTNKIKQQYYGFMAMCVHRKSYPHFAKSFVLRLGLLLLTFFGYTYDS